MNLADLIAPDQGKVQPTRSPDGQKAEEDTDSTFAALVADQVTDEAQAPKDAEAEASIGTGKTLGDLTKTVSATLSNGNGVAPIEGEEAPASGTSLAPTSGSLGSPAGQGIAGVSAISAQIQDADAPILPTQESSKSVAQIEASAKTAPVDIEGAVPKTAEDSAALKGVKPVTKVVETPAAVEGTTLQHAATQIQGRIVSGRTLGSREIPSPETPTPDATSNGKAEKTVVPALDVRPSLEQAVKSAEVTQTARISLTENSRTHDNVKAQNSQSEKTPVTAEAPSETQLIDKLAAKKLLSSDTIEAPPVTVRRSTSTQTGYTAPFSITESVVASSSGTVLQSVNSAASSDPTVKLLDPRAMAQHAAPQIVNALAARTPGTSIDMTLDPPELGRIEIMIDFAENGLRATLTADRQTTSDLLRRHADVLSEHFEEAGFSDVDLSFGEQQRRTAEDGLSGDAEPEAQLPLTQNPTMVSSAQKASPHSRGTGMDILL